jgi:hypothetical protein
MAQQNLDVFQVVADAGRRQMMTLLGKESMTIKILEYSGFISIKDSGRERICSLKPDGFKEIQRWVNYFDKFWASKLEDLSRLMALKAGKDDGYKGKPSGHDRTK